MDLGYVSWMMGGPIITNTNPLKPTLTFGDYRTLSN